MTARIDDHRLLFTHGLRDLGPEDLRLWEVRAEEALSRSYEAVLELECTVEGGLSPEVIRKLFTTTCSVGFGAHGMTQLAGVLREIRMLPMSGDARAHYRAVLVPRFWQTSLERKCRVFNETSVPDMVRAVLTKDHGWEEGRHFELRLSETYGPREYVVQYEETDFAFLSRWLERYGIFYFFEQTDHGDKLVLADGNRETVAVAEHPRFRYELRDGVVSEPGWLARLERVSTQRPATTHVRDYNWRGPAVTLGDAPVDEQTGYGLWASHGDHVKDDAEAGTMARLRAEAWKTASERYHGVAATPSMSPGHWLELEQAPIGDLEQRYLVTRVVHHAAQVGPGTTGGATYSNTFEAIAYDVPFRPERATPWPRIDGVMYATVDGAGGGTAAPIDDQGRYRIVLPFDMKPGAAGQASRWVRMAQPSAGGSYGMHFPLHIGAEVLVAHVGGDPDRPVIVGAVPNPSNAAFIGAARATRSAIRTRSGILVDFEDDA